MPNSLPPVIREAWPGSRCVSRTICLINPQVCVANMIIFLLCPWFRIVNIRHVVFKIPDQTGSGRTPTTCTADPNGALIPSSQPGLHLNSFSSFLLQNSIFVFVLKSCLTWKSLWNLVWNRQCIIVVLVWWSQFCTCISVKHARCSVLVKSPTHQARLKWNDGS